MIKQLHCYFPKQTTNSLYPSIISIFTCKFPIMAEAVVSVLLENLSSFIHKEVVSFMGVKEELERLSSKLTIIQAVLADAEMKQLTHMTIKNWLQKLEDAAYVLDDIIDECATQDLLQEYQQQKHGWVNKVHTSCHSSFGLKNAMFHRRIAKKMKKIRETLDSIAEERKMFDLFETTTRTKKKDELMDWRQTSSVITQPEVYGREEDKERIVQSLIGTLSDVEHLSVYPIVGMGGLGKTTLAQLIFNDDRVTEHFELKIWVCVSDDFSLKRMTKAILESALGSACEDLDLDPLQKRLQQTLHRRRYLLVLDDMWNEDQEKWDRLKYSLAACGSKGASVLVTTRLPKVASIMGTLPPHHLSCLSDDSCWSLFKQRAFELDAEESEKLVAIGKEIVKKCKGLPLAAKALGGLLRFKREEKEWLHVKESEIWNLPQDENSILPALRLSYLNLPLISRRCFSYCAMFPKDFIIFKDELIHLWMANGLISSTGIMMAEDIGDEIIKELCWTSFFQDIEKDDFGNVKWFRIHDLLHDLAQSVTGDVCGTINGERLIEHPKRIRHLTIQGYLSNQMASFRQVKSLRTFYGEDYYDHLLSSFDILRFDSLRALKLGYLYLEDKTKLLSLITHFKHLRCLNLGGMKITKLPESISDLCNLQVLNLDGCYRLKELPRHLKCLKGLRHLCLRRCTSLSRVSHEMGRLNFLRTLSIYVVGRRKGFWLAELGHLGLKGQLHIKNLEKVKSAMDAKEANLKDKQLDELFLSWARNSQSELQQNVEQILESLEPHSKLLSLGVGGYKGGRFPHWMGNPSFDNLCYIRLMDCRYILQLPHLGKLASLKKLRIHNMHHVCYVDEESYDGGVVRGFPSLEYLLLSYMPNLERLSKQEGGDMFPCLSELTIVECPKLTLPSLPSVRKLRIIKRCDSLDLGFVSIQALPQHSSRLGGSNQVLLDSIHNLQGLEFLCFEDDQEFTSFPVGMLRDLACLRQLHIHRQSKLKVLPTEQINMVAVEELHIRRCDSLESLTEQELNGLSSLRRLAIDWCYKFKGLSTGFQYLTSLKDLTIADCPEVVVLSDDLQHVPLLQSLTLYALPNLESLPECLGSLTSLQSLYIARCPKLTSLPLSVGWVDSLKSLTIGGCPELQKRFEKETGLDYHWIAHVPHVDLGKQGWVFPSQLENRISSRINELGI